MTETIKLWRFPEGYTVTWYDETEKMEFARDYPDGEEYPYSDWVTAPDYVGEYTTEREAWVAAAIDARSSEIGDPRLHPRYSYRYKCIV